MRSGLLGISRRMDLLIFYAPQAMKLIHFTPLKHGNPTAPGNPPADREDAGS
jgi:hypothetical protein